jgi:hypothetical protein
MNVMNSRAPEASGCSGRPSSPSAASAAGNAVPHYLSVVYVCRLYIVGRNCMDIDNSRGYLGPRQTCKASNVCQ